VALRHAIELDPNNPYASNYLALVLTQKGRTEESVQVARELALANPVSINFRRAYANILFYARRYDEAIAEYERLIKLDPNFMPTYHTYAQALVAKGRFQEAEVAFGHRKNGISPGIHAWLLALQGNVAAARQILKENASSPDDPTTAVTHYLLGEKELGLGELDYLANQAWAAKNLLSKG
jgi:Flp pilus assembly protein TadD